MKSAQRRVVFEGGGVSSLGQENTSLRVVSPVWAHLIFILFVVHYVELHVQKLCLHKHNLSGLVEFIGAEGDALS